MGIIILIVFILLWLTVPKFGLKAILSLFVASPIGAVMGFYTILFYETFENSSYNYGWEIIPLYLGGIILGALIGFLLPLFVLHFNKNPNEYAARLHRNKIRRWKKVRSTQSGASILHNYLHLTEEEN